MIFPRIDSTIYKIFNKVCLVFQSIGHGRLIFNNGDRYDGEFIENKMHGAGRLRFHDGGIFQGLWV